MGRRCYTVGAGFLITTVLVLLLLSAAYGQPIGDESETSSTNDLGEGWHYSFFLYSDNCDKTNTVEIQHCNYACRRYDNHIYGKCSTANRCICYGSSDYECITYTDKDIKYDLTRWFNLSGYENVECKSYADGFDCDYKCRDLFNAFLGTCLYGKCACCGYVPPPQP